MKKMTIGLVLLLSTNALVAGFCNKYDCSAMADEIISQDSRSWSWNRYDHGSAKLERVTFTSPSGIKVKFIANYTYNGGRSGWAEIRLNDGEFDCIRYHDFPSTCRGFR